MRGGEGSKMREDWGGDGMVWGRRARGEEGNV